MSLFDDRAGSTRVFEDRDVLLDEHIPNQLVARDEQVDQYIQALMPVYDGFAPDHCFLFGPNGSGKTAATRFMLRELRNSDEGDVDLTTVWLRCNGVGTDYMLAIKLANRILPADKQLNRGHAEDVVYDRLFDALEQIGGTILVVLDEIDRIEDLDTFLYEVTRARSAGGRLDDAKVGVIGISKDSAFYENLSTDVKSSLNGKTIDFPAYDANDLREIIEARVDEAFVDSAVASDVPPLCAAHGAKFSGDARFALDLLREAGDLAKQADDDVVEKDHVEHAKDVVLEDRVSKLLENQTEEAKRVVYALCVLAAKGETSPRTKKVYEKYRTIAETAGSKPVVNVQVTEYLNQLEAVGLTEIEKNTGSGGRYNKHTLRYEVGDVVAALEDHITASGVVLDPIAGLLDVEQGVEA